MSDFILPEKFKCKCSINICEISVNCGGSAIIDTKQLAPETTEYTLRLKYLNSFHHTKAQITAGQPIKFTNVFVNEQYCYEANVLIGEAKQVFTISGAQVDTFKFCTIPIKS